MKRLLVLAVLVSIVSILAACTVGPTGQPTLLIDTLAQNFTDDAFQK